MMVTACVIILEEMLTIGHISDHLARRHLHDSLRRERELGNRIAVLVAEKERRLKEIEKRVTLIHEGQELRAEKALRKEEVMLPPFSWSVRCRRRGGSSRPIVSWRNRCDATFRWGCRRGRRRCCRRSEAGTANQKSNLRATCSR